MKITLETLKQRHASQRDSFRDTQRDTKRAKRLQLLLENIQDNGMTSEGQETAQWIKEAKP